MQIIWLVSIWLGTFIVNGLISNNSGHQTELIMRQLIFYPKSQQSLILPKDTDEWHNIRRIFSSFYFPYLKRCLDLNPHSNTNLAKAATLKLQNGIKWENGLNSNNLTENVLHIRRIKYRKKNETFCYADKNAEAANRGVL